MMTALVSLKQQTNNMNIGSGVPQQHHHHHHHTTNSMQQNQLTRSLERILEDAHLSGELKLSGRKLKDFPKVAGKYNLNDTVIADLSRNRFCELPEDVTGFPFLETLLVYHNTIRSIPESVRGLYSLSYLDLRSNQLSVLPREICMLPLQVLLVSNNRLLSLPEELGRMDNLTELDAACNQITHLPTRMSDLKNLRSLSLRSNQLVYLPREIKYLNLVFLDISCNRIASLPIELRLMTSLVHLELNNNPLTSPPASLCVRGIVHVFKYLDTMASKEEKNRNGGSFDGHTTLRRTHNNTSKQQSASFTNVEAEKIRKQLSDPGGYISIDGHHHSHHQQEKSIWSDEMDSKWPLHISVDGTATPSTMSPSGDIYDLSQMDRELKRSITPTNTPTQIKRQFNSQSNSNDTSPEGGDLDSPKTDEKMKAFGNVQTYREYKEALRQQRNQDSSSIYRPKDQQTPTPTNGKTLIGGNGDTKSQNISPTNYSNPNSPIFVHNKTIITDAQLMSPNQNGHSSPLLSNKLHHQQQSQLNDNAKTEETIIAIVTSPTSSVNHKKPVQKVTPSRNMNAMASYKNSSSTTSTTATPTSSSTLSTNGNSLTDGCDGYVKPKSPTHAAGSYYSNTMPASTQSMSKIAVANKAGTQKPNRSVSWNRDIPAEKLSFTMRREFDRQKEETELIEQLRQIIESRLKMSLPKDIASALCDGVVLCHLANHVRPRSVGSIHVPSPAVPKLTMARCRRNVDNFLNACRSIGVDEELICSCEDIVPLASTSTTDNIINTTDDKPSTNINNDDNMDDNDHHNYLPHTPNLMALYRTIAALHNIAIQLKNENNNGTTSSSSTKTTATNTKTSTNGSSLITNIDYYHIDDNNSCSKIVDDDIIDNNRFYNQLNLDANNALNNQINYNNSINLNAKPPLYGGYGVGGGVGGGNNVNGRRSATTPNTLDLSSAAAQTKRRKLSNARRSVTQQKNNAKKYENFLLNGILEECEYDSDIGKFNCKIDSEDNSSSSFDYVDSSGSDKKILFDFYAINNKQDDGCDEVADNDNYHKEQQEFKTGIVKSETFLKRIEFFESNATPTASISNSSCSSNNSYLLVTKDARKLNELKINDENNDTQLSTILCLSVFVLAFVLLLVFEIPS